MAEEFEALKKLVDREIQDKLEELILTRRDLRKITLTVERLVNSIEGLSSEISKQKAQIGQLGRNFVENLNNVAQLILALKSLINNVENKETKVMESINSILNKINENKTLISSGDMRILHEIKVSMDTLNIIKGIATENKSSLDQIKTVLGRLEKSINLGNSEIAEVINTLDKNNEKLVEDLEGIKGSLNALSSALNSLSNILAKILQIQKENRGSILNIISQQELLSKSTEGIVNLLKKLIDLQQKAFLEQKKKLDNLHVLYRELKSSFDKLSKVVNEMSKRANNTAENT